jgi:hypothetical protein
MQSPDREAPRTLRGAFLCGELPAFRRRASVARSSGAHHVQHQTLRAWFQRQAAGRTDGVSDQPSSYTPVRWTPGSDRSAPDPGSGRLTPAFWAPNADQYGNAKIQLSKSYSSPTYWSDLLDAVKPLGEAANAMVNGAYSLAPGTFNLARAAGRGLGLYGSEEAQRFRQEMTATGHGLRFRESRVGRANGRRACTRGLEDAANAAILSHRPRRHGCSSYLSRRAYRPLCRGRRYLARAGERPRCD